VNLGVGRKAKHLALGSYHTCAILDNDTVKCWGYAIALGTNDFINWGSNSVNSVSALPNINFGGQTVRNLWAGNFSTCALLQNGVLKCWGRNSYGEIGYDLNKGNEPNEMGDNLPYLQILPAPPP
jgi:alpha-tubulin suppressor-like RCC1 family protein